MEEDDGSSQYPENKIINPNGPDAVGIFASRISDVHWSNTAEGQGAGGGTKLEGDGHNLGNVNIKDNIITALNGKSDVGMFIFHNVRVYWSNAGQGQGGREFEGIFHNISDNEITAENSTKVGLENFGNINYNCKTTSTKDHGKAPGGSSSAQGLGGEGGKKPKGDDLNIHDNNITGDKVPTAYHNFSNFECNLKTTKTEDGGSTNQSIIYNNQITARNGSSNVGMFNLHNIYINAGQAQGGCEGNEGFRRHEGISHKIRKNTIIADKSRKVGLQNFGNIKYNCKPTIISRFLNFF